MKSQSLDSILGDFDLSPNADSSSERECISIWVPAEYHARYEKLQRQSRRRFAKKLRELIQAAIEVAEERAS